MSPSSLPISTPPCRTLEEVTQRKKLLLQSIRRQHRHMESLTQEIVTPIESAIRQTHLLAQSVKAGTGTIGALWWGIKMFYKVYTWVSIHRVGR